MKLDGLARKIAGLGVPGLVLLVAASATGYAGAAAVTTALAAFGPFGMVGGIGALVLVGLISDGIAKYGIEAILSAVLDQLVEEGHTREEMIQKVEGYPISEDLKLKLNNHVSDHFG